MGQPRRTPPHEDLEPSDGQLAGHAGTSNGLRKNAYGRRSHQVEDVVAMKCPNCGAENPDEKKFCGDCGSPLKAVDGLSAKWKKSLAKQTASIIILISVLLIIIGLGFNDRGEDLGRVFGLHEVGTSFVSLAWFFGFLGIAGFFVAGLAYLLTLPIPRKERSLIRQPELPGKGP